MNIEKITELYNAMMQLQELIEAEGTTSAIDCISGLRLSSAEFRTAFFRVRDTLMQCPVSKTKTPSKSDDNSVTEEKSTKQSVIPQTNEPKFSIQFIPSPSQYQTAKGLAELYNDICDPEKTGGRKLVSAHGCSSEHPVEDMLRNKKLLHKTHGHQYEHIVIETKCPVTGGYLTPEEFLSFLNSAELRIFPEVCTITAVHVHEKFLHAHVIVDGINAITGKRVQRTSDEFKGIGKKLNELFGSMDCLHNPNNTENNSEKTEASDSVSPTVNETKSTPVVKKSEASKSNHIDFNEFDEFIIESYDSDEKSDISICDLLRSYRICRHKENLTPPVYAAYRRYLSSIFKMEADIIKGLKPKLDPELRIENSEYGKIYRHPEYTDIWCSEAGVFYYRGPSGELAEKSVGLSNGSYMISVTGYKNNPTVSARRVALECFLQRKLPAGSYVFHRNGNKRDFSINNLSIRGMSNYISQEKSYTKSDVNECCEYIVAHNKDISLIEQDTHFRIGWQFAKNILDKKTHRDISDKYF